MSKKSMLTIWQMFARFALVFCLIVISRPGFAAEPADAAKCVAIPGSGERLKCYDGLGGRSNAKDVEEPFIQFDTGSTPAQAAGTTAVTALSVRWELDPETKQGPWVLRPYRPLFVLPVRSSDNPNVSPQSPTQPSPPTPVPYNNSELEFQLSLKTKGGENLFGTHADLWFGYTQQSQWQVYNSQISRPFRETNYQPELFLSIPTHYELFGLTGRFIDLGVVHQSNGRTNPLSRSWNRVYAQFGFERGNFALLVRPWHRVEEDATTDNNPDITHYMGNGDVTAIYKLGRQEFTLLGRFNTGSGYGAAEGTWSFPVDDRLKGYVKFFTGYGETLIDYNWKQTTIGIGVLLADWL